MLRQCGVGWAMHTVSASCAGVQACAACVRLTLLVKPAPALPAMTYVMPPLACVVHLPLRMAAVQEANGVAVSISTINVVSGNQPLWHTGAQLA